jgi:RND family efflux transporter MFP subunit
MNAPKPNPSRPDFTGVRPRPFAAATLSALALVGLLNGCGHKAPHATGTAPEPPPVPVQVVKAELRPVSATEEVVGTVRAKLRANLEAKVAGRITQMPVVAGQAVKRGDLIAQLEVQEIQARLDQARAAAEQAERDLQRYATLLQQKAVTQAEYDGMEARARIARATVAEATTMLEYARITAPFDGVVSRKFADVGDLASPGRPLVELEDPASLRIEADVAEALIDRVQPGARMQVQATGRDTPLEGVVSEIAPAADPNSRTFRVKLDLPPNAGLRLGQFARVLIPLGETPALCVPAEAVVRRGQMHLVFVVEEGRARLRLVKVGKPLGAEVELLSGVQPGDLVVRTGAAQLRDGQPVQVP